MKKTSEKCKHHPKHFGPEGYLDWYEWAQKRYKQGWRQLKCKTCQLYVEWVRPLNKPRQ